MNRKFRVCEALSLVDCSKSARFAANNRILPARLISGNGSRLSFAEVWHLQVFSTIYDAGLKLRLAVQLARELAENDAASAFIQDGRLVTSPSPTRATIVIPLAALHAALLRRVDAAGMRAAA